MKIDNTRALTASMDAKLLKLFLEMRCSGTHVADLVSSELRKLTVFILCILAPSVFRQIHDQFLIYTCGTFLFTIESIILKKSLSSFGEIRLCILLPSLFQNILVNPWHVSSGEPRPTELIAIV